MLTSATVPLINHLLRQSNFARARLRSHHGKVVRIEVAPLTFDFAVLDSGEVTPAAADATADAVLTLTPPLAVRVLAGEKGAAQEVRISGDGELAADINFIVANLSYDAEEDLSLVIGDIAAHRVASIGRGFLAWQKTLFGNFGHAAAEFFTFEQPLLVHPAKAREFIAEVDELRDAVARLEKRLRKLTLAEEAEVGAGTETTTQFRRDR